MNQGLFGFPNLNDSLSVSRVNNQVGSVMVNTTTPGRYIATTDMGSGTSGYKTGDGGFTECYYGSAVHRLGASNTGVMVANRLYFATYFFSYPTRIDGLTIQSGNTVTTGNMLFGIYQSDEFGLPTQTIYTSPSISVGAGFSLNTVRNRSGLTPPLLGYYNFAAIFDSTPTMAAIAAGNAGYNQAGYGTRGPLVGLTSIGMQYDVGSFIIPQSIRRQDLVFTDFSTNSPHTANISFTVVGQRGI